MNFFLAVMALLFPLMGTTSELRLLSWNVFMLPKPINFSLQSQRTKLIAEQLRNSPHDIILMQEAFRKSFRSHVGRTLRREFPHQEFLQRSIRPTHLMNSGLFVVSRHPFEVLDHWYFTRCTHADCLSAKGVLLIELTLPSSKKVQIAMTHAQAWDDPKAIKVRAFQFQEIKNLLDLHAREGIPQVLAGDFNIDGAASHEYPFLLAESGMEARALDGEIKFTSGFKVDCYKTPKGLPFQWLDHVWINPRGSEARIINNTVKVYTGVLKDKECPLSDHHSLEASVQL